MINLSIILLTVEHAVVCKEKMGNSGSFFRYLQTGDLPLHSGLLQHPHQNFSTDNEKIREQRVPLSNPSCGLYASISLAIYEDLIRDCGHTLHDQIYPFWRKSQQLKRSLKETHSTRSKALEMSVLRAMKSSEHLLEDLSACSISWASSMLS